MKKSAIIGLLFVFALVISGCGLGNHADVILESIPPFSGDAYCVLNDNVPEFTEADMTTKAFEQYAPLDRLGRCGSAMACLGRELMPTEDRGSISSVKPSGWVQAEYDFVDGGNLYNRCHLIGFQLTGENANERNLITGTRFLNIEGMLPFENMVADYIQETGNHVLYRVTPIFTDDCLVAEGVRMEALSVEDNGAGICFHIYAYNYQPNVLIDYKTGESIPDYRDEFTPSKEQTNYFILNIKSKKFHLPDCKQARNIYVENCKEFVGDRETLLSMGYAPAGCCNP